MKLINWCSFLLYVSLIGYIVFFAKRRQVLDWNSEMVELIPFKNTVESYHVLKDHLNYPWFFATNFFGNIFLFIPLAYFLNELFKSSKSTVTIVIGSLVSLLIELFQYTLKIGVFDIDDILLNTIGIIVGEILYKKLQRNFQIKKLAEKNNPS